MYVMLAKTENVTFGTFKVGKRQSKFNLAQNKLKQQKVKACSCAYPPSHSTPSSTPTPPLSHSFFLLLCGCLHTWRMRNFNLIDS